MVEWEKQSKSLFHFSISPFHDLFGPSNFQLTSKNGECKSVSDNMLGILTIGFWRVSSGGRRCKMMRKLVLILMVLLFAFATTRAVFAQQGSLPSMTVTLTGAPESYQGACPVVIRFKGAINTTRPARVHYKFVRSDEAYSPTATAQFETAGARELNAGWTVGTAEQSRYEGWMMLKVVYPGEVESSKARFNVVCTGMSVDLPDLTIDELTLDDQCRVVVKAKNLGPGPVFDEVWTDHKPESAGINLYIDGKAWGSEIIWLLDPQKSLRNPGGTVVYRSNLKVSGTQTVKARIDQTRQVKEKDETNNERTALLTCKAPGPEKQ
jgi:hypothetical protein